MTGTPDDSLSSTAEHARAARDTAGPEPGPAAGPDHAEQTYETAAARVEAIIRRLDGGTAGLRETLELVKEGRGLIEFCARELDAVSTGLEELRLEELVERLELPSTPRIAERRAGTP
jgi:exodeoxyribonuclease VII small subunit